MTWSRTKTLSVALFLSLALNLLIGGAMIGRWGWHGDHHDRGGRHWGARFWLERALGEEAAPKVEKLWDAHRQQLKPLRKASKQARIEVQAALSAEKFDAETYAKALDASLEKSMAIRASHHAFMTELATTLTPEQRAKLAEFAGRKRWRRHHD
jgi:Spy/CpxP family protein refolding chaperone